MIPDYLVFPDGSVRRKGDKLYAGFACVIVNTKTSETIVLSDRLSDHCTIVFSEAWAVYRGLERIAHLIRHQKRSKDKINVLVVSDSKLTTDIFNIWIPNCWNTSDWLCWRKEDGSVVKNQTLYRQILSIIFRNNLKVKFVHINSHTENNTQMRNRIKYKMRSSKIRINNDQLDMFIKLNQIADDAAQKITSEAVRENPKEFIRMEWKKC